jgi:hypothetical protein
MSLDFNRAPDRRRFYLERGLRKRPLGSGSDLEGLMSLPRKSLSVDPAELFKDIQAVVIGGVATRSYAPERSTEDLDLLIEHRRFGEASQRIRQAGYEKIRDLDFPNASLGLYGEAWSKAGLKVDMVATAQRWGRLALKNPQLDTTGLPIVRLPFLVLMKFDSARAIDQGDLSRMLGRLNDEECEALIREVAKHSNDPSFADDVRQYAQLGRWEWETP